MKNSHSLVAIFIVSLMLFPTHAFAFKFGVLDAGKIFSKYNETQKTKNFLEAEKNRLQKELDSKKKAVAELDQKYVETAKKLQNLRDNKKEAEAKALEAQLKSQREALAAASADLEKFFQESQKRLYELEDQKMGDLSRALDEQVSKVVDKVAKSQGLEAVFEKRFCYWWPTMNLQNDPVDITDMVLDILNSGSSANTSQTTKPTITAPQKKQPK